MGNYGELFGLSGYQIKFLIACLGEHPITEAGEIRDKFRRAYGQQVTSETIQRIADKFPKKVEKAREDFLQSYKKHPLYNKRKIQDNLQKVIELGFDEEAFGFKEWDEQDPQDPDKKIHRVMPLTRIRDLKSVVAANKICLELIQADEKAEAPAGDKQSKQKSEDDGAGGLTVVRS